MEIGGMASMVIFSFGFKYGEPVGVNLLLDVRLLPNPYWVENLRPHTGKEQAVAAYVLESESGMDFLRRIVPLLSMYAEAYPSAKILRVAIGCTGGRHRSVAIAEKLAAILREQSIDVQLFHRDIDKDSLSETA